MTMRKIDLDMVGLYVLLLSQLWIVGGMIVSGVSFWVFLVVGLAYIALSLFLMIEQEVKDANTKQNLPQEHLQNYQTEAPSKMSQEHQHTDDNQNHIQRFDESSKEMKTSGKLQAPSEPVTDAPTEAPTSKTIKQTRKRPSKVADQTTDSSKTTPKFTAGQTETVRVMHKEIK